MRSYFVSPIGYIYLAIFLAVSGVIFALTTLTQGSSADIGAYFSYMLMSFFVVLPILTMKLFADEKKQRTETLLISSPVSLMSMVCAKFFAAFSMFMIGFAASLVNFIPFLYECLTKRIRYEIDRSCCSAGKDYFLPERRIYKILY